MINPALEAFKKGLEEQAVARLKKNSPLKYPELREVRIDLTERSILMRDAVGRVLVRYGITELGNVTAFDKRR